jgi:high-affinity iron transporter
MPAAGIETSSASSASDAQRLTFLLQYIGTDYDRAVRDGAVINDSEYGEVLRFVRQLIQGYGARPKRERAVTDGLARLEQQMKARAPANEVWALTRQLLPKLRASLGSMARPERIPDLASGRRLWMHDCAICHGEGGGGDGSAATDMEPPPTAFRGEYLERLAPQQVFDAVSVGVEGTAMPSFASAYDDAPRWDVAFFTMTLRVGFAPKRPSVAEHVSLTELADSSDAELLARLRRTQPDASAEHVDWLRVNLVSAPGQAAPPADTGVANAVVSRSRSKCRTRFASVADRVFPRVVGVASLRARFVLDRRTAACRAW